MDSGRETVNKNLVPHQSCSANYLRDSRSGQEQHESMFLEHSKLGRQKKNQKQNWKKIKVNLI